MERGDVETFQCLLNFAGYEPKPHTLEDGKSCIAVNTTDPPSVVALAVAYELAERCGQNEFISLQNEFINLIKIFREAKQVPLELGSLLCFPIDAA